MPEIRRIPFRELSLGKQKELDRQIDVEIRKKSANVAFVPDEYRRLRRNGYSPDEIHYDMCHVFR